MRVFLQILVFVVVVFPLRSQPHVPQGLQYVLPLANASGVSPRTSLVIRPGDALRPLQAWNDFIRVSGSSSGAHTCRFGLVDDNKTIIIEPQLSFVEHETIDVNLKSGILTAAGQVISSSRYLFFTGEEILQRPPSTIESGMPASTDAASSEFAKTSELVLNGVGLPSDFPFIKVAVNSGSAPGDLFFNNWGGTPYMFILKNDGTPRFYRKMPSRARDFKIQPNGMLTYRLADPFNVFYGLDSTFTLVDTFACKNGYGTDEHDLQLLPNGHALMIALDWKTVDMSTLVSGGNPSATVVGNHIQELDEKKRVVFEWRSWDHFDIADAVYEDLRASNIDYAHMNAISVDTDGNIVVSSRQLSEITKINRQTGAIMWRLGGAHNQFNFTNDVQQFSYQHDIRALGNNHFTMFDNGNHKPVPYSRAVEYVIDTTLKTATMVWQYRHSPDWYSWWMGNAQRLPNGNTLICWADQSLPKVTEVTPAGTIVYQNDFVSSAHCYRAFRFDWMGNARVPYLVVEPYIDKVTLIVNMWGSSGVKQYRVYAGSVPSPTTLVDSGSGPIITLTNLPNETQCYFRVTAVDSLGGVSDYSNEESAFVRFAAPGENLIVNPSFNYGTGSWALDLYDNAIASGTVTLGKYVLSVTTPGPNSWSVQMKQGNIPLIQGKEYLFEFDAAASATRTIYVPVEQDGGAYTNYSLTSTVALTTTMKHFSFPFTMTSPTDLRARVTINCGLATPTVTLDNISIKEIVPSFVSENSSLLPGQPWIVGAYPNPFNPETILEYQLPEAGHISLTIVDLLGREVAVLVKQDMSAGSHRVSWDASGVPSGMYVAQIRMLGGTMKRLSNAVKLAVLR